MDARDEPLWKPTSILRHELDDGAVHFDWLLGLIPTCHDPDALVARTFRSADRLDSPLPRNGVGLEALALHRWFYLLLDHSHTLSKGRGVVSPVAQGFWREGQSLHGVHADHGDGAEEIDIRWGASATPRRMRITTIPTLRVIEVSLGR
ncbi:MAG: hypothetical protein EXS15_07310 [Phycisphaerales bacterium]|nr:hypothetical protein [Phycisphaerales bacterium]